MKRNVEKLVEDGIKYLNQEVSNYYKGLRERIYLANEVGAIKLNKEEINGIKDTYEKLETKRIERGLKSSDYLTPPWKIKTLLNAYLTANALAMHHIPDKKFTEVLEK